MLTPCSCGNTSPHEIAKRRTFDGRTVLFWSDGGVTWAFGFRIPGIGVARWRHRRERDVRAAWIVAGLIELYDAADVPKLVRVARTELAKPGHYDQTAIIRCIVHEMDTSG